MNAAKSKVCQVRGRRVICCRACHLFQQETHTICLDSVRLSDSLPQFGFTWKTTADPHLFLLSYHVPWPKTQESILLLTNFKARCCNDCAIHHIKTTIPHEKLLIPLSDLTIHTNSEDYFHQNKKFTMKSDILRCRHFHVWYKIQEMHNWV